MEVVPVETTDVQVTVPDDVSNFVKLVTELLLKKPQTKAEAVELYHELTSQLGKWVVKDLPAAEQKMALMGLWAVEQVSTASCWPRK